MVGDDTHSDIRLSIRSIFDPSKGSNRLNHRGEDIGIIVRRLPLHSHTEALKAHPGINNLIGKRLKRTISLAVILHEDQVPNLDDLRMALVDQRKPIYGLTLFV